MEQTQGLTHNWERHGFKAPYSYVGYFRQRTSCNVCGTYIVENFQCRDANGKLFVVGSDCIYKMGDVKLINEIKQVKKAIAKQKRDEKRIEQLRIQRELKAKREEERLAKLEEGRKQNIANFHEQFSEFSDAFNFAYASEDAPQFIHSIAQSIANYGNPSEKQLKYLADAYQRYIVTNIPKSDCPQGEVVITGTVISTKWQESPYYGRSGTLKMLVQDDRGFKVYGTAPSSLDAKLQGERVTFTATVTPSQNDPNFGFYSRPKKSAFIN